MLDVNNMNITNLKYKFNNYGALSLLLSASIFSSCQKQKIYTPMPSEYVTSLVSHKVDSFVKSSEHIKNDKDYEFFATDTIELDKDFTDNPQIFQKRILKRANKLNPKIKKGEKVSMTVVPIKGIGVPIGDMSMVQKIETVYEKKYRNTEVVVASNQILTTDSTDMYLPVQYYGKKDNK